MVLLQGGVTLFRGGGVLYPMGWLDKPLGGRIVRDEGGFGQGLPLLTDVMPTAAEYEVPIVFSVLAGTDKD